MFRYVNMFHVFDNVMYLFDCQHFMYYNVLYVFLHSFFCYNINLYFVPASLHYIISTLLSN